MNLTRGSRRRCRRGGVMLEAALVLPVLIMLSFGVIEFGHHFYVQHMVKGAAQAGARQGMLGASEAQIGDAVDKALAGSGVSALEVGVSSQEVAELDLMTIRVTVQARSGIIRQPRTVSGTAVMAME